MSKFIKKLRQVSESAAPTLGFKMTATSPDRLMLLIAALPQGSTGGVAQLAEAEVDAILMHSHDLIKDLRILKQMADGAGDLPWGVWLGAMTEEGVEKLREIGGDFLIFVASEAPAALMQEEIGKVVKIVLPCDDSLIKTIDQLPIDAVLLDLKEEGGSITVSQLMNCQRLTGLISKPLLVAVKQGLTDKEVRALWEAGANGVVIEVGEEPQPGLTKLCQAIALPQGKRKPMERGVVLPHPE